MLVYKSVECALLATLPKSACVHTQAMLLVLLLKTLCIKKGISAQKLLYDCVVTCMHVKLGT